MRTLKLTHEQIELIQKALSLAEMHYAKIHEQIISAENSMRFNVDKIDSSFFLESCKYADINIDITNGDKDI